MVHLRTGPLVRAVDSTSAVIWAETSSPCQVTLQAIPYQAPNTEAEPPMTTSAHTITFGGRHYVAPLLEGLQPSTWYSYTFTLGQEQETSNGSLSLAPLPLQCFRTLDTESDRSGKELRLMYGSCRKLGHRQNDILNALGSWLLDHFEQRDSTWPHLLLLLGDQIYADDPPYQLQHLHPFAQQYARTFEDFACLYEYSWTYKQGVRQVLATIPTYMMYDDHEVYNNWNISPWWRSRMIKQGQEQLLVDGLAAYWVYQGWGNLSSQARKNHPLMDILFAAEQSGEDALEHLRERIRESVYGRTTLPWHYTISTHPPIFVMNTRADRSTVFEEDSEAIYAAGRIMGEQQMRELGDWLHAHTTKTLILASSVPILLPPAIGLAEYMMGVRLWYNSIAPLRWLGRQLARFQLLAALRVSFDHWPLYNVTWHELMQLIQEHPGNIFVLSGDVHFSYAAQGYRLFHRWTKRFYQFVSSPMQNELSKKDRRLIETQALLPAAFYGGLFTRIMPIQSGGKMSTIRHNLLFQDTLASLIVQRDGENPHNVRHEYLGLYDERIEVVGYSKLDIPK